jgi:hypothetical protein
MKMQKYLENLTDEELLEFGKCKSMIEFCHRFMFSLDDLDNITPEIQEAIVNLLWDNLFNICSPFYQTIVNHDRFTLAKKENKWEFISIYDFKLTKEYIKFEKTKWKKYSKNKEKSLQEAKKLFNRIVHLEYFK